jgi:hypothetical protein
LGSLPSCSRCDWCQLRPHDSIALGVVSAVRGSTAADYAQANTVPPVSLLILGDYMQQQRKLTLVKSSPQVKNQTYLVIGIDYDQEADQWILIRSAS